MQENTTLTARFPAFSALLPLQKRQVTHWLLLALLSITLSGIAPLLLLAGRASIYAEMAAVKAWFVPVLVIHVNLSVGLWFLALAVMLWRVIWPILLPLYWHGASVLSFLFGVVAMVLAPLAGGEAFTSNYIPVQNNPLFFFGLSLIFVALLLMISAYLWAMLRQGEGALTAAQQWVGMNVLTLLVALGCFGLSILQHPPGFGGEPYYEAIWWGGGHVLQFVYVQIALLSWVWLAHRLAIDLPVKMTTLAFALLTFTAALSPLAYWLFDINSYHHIKFFSWQMNIVTGTVPGVVALWLLWKLFAARADTSVIPAKAGISSNLSEVPACAGMTKKKREGRLSAHHTTLFMSLLLFLSGGVVGYLIEGSNTIIPAHYHGSTVGVTLALMGAGYLLLPYLQKADVSQWKMAKWQPVLYGTGQLLHVIGFAIAGAEGAGRKMAGSMESASELAQAGMQLVRLGGILAVIGGGLFVVVMIRAWRRPAILPQNAAETTPADR